MRLTPTIDQRVLPVFMVSGLSTAYETIKNMFNDKQFQFTTLIIQAFSFNQLIQPLYYVRKNGRGESNVDVVHPVVSPDMRQPVAEINLDDLVIDMKSFVAYTIKAGQQVNLQFNSFYSDFNLPLIVNNNTDQDFPWVICGDNAPSDNSNATIEYQYDFTDFAYKTGSLTLLARMTGEEDFTTYTAQVQESTAEGVLAALNSLGLGVWISYTSEGNFYISLFSLALVLSTLTVPSEADSVSYSWSVRPLVATAYRVNVALYFSDPTGSITVNWGDGVEEEVTMAPDMSLYHDYAGGTDRTIELTYPSSSSLYAVALNRVVALLAFTPLADLTGLSVADSPALTETPALPATLMNFSVTYSGLTALRPMTVAIDTVDITGCNVSAVEVSTALIELDTNGLSNGYFDCRGQATPIYYTDLTTGGQNAADSLVVKGWDVFFEAP